MKILLAPDSLKGTISSMEAIEYLEEAAKMHFAPLEIVKVPIADGGEGTVESLVTAAKGEYRKVEVTDPLGRRITATYGIINGNTAVIEMAQASGLPILSDEERNPLLTTTYGTGELIKVALEEGFRDIVIGIGGSATNDGGIGAAQALGIKFTDDMGNSVGFGGGQLSKISRIDMDGLDSRIKQANITVICDVNNPLLGENGATYIFGPQKGADDEKLKTLEQGMTHYANIVKKQTGLDIANHPGAGAAGGLGAALIGFLGAHLKSGIDTMLDFIRFEDLLTGVDLVVTGEGKIDGQSVFGKVPVGIAKRCKPKNIPVVAIVGIMGDEAQKVYEHGIQSIMPTVNRDMPLEEALSRAEELFRDAADRMFRFISIGKKFT